MAIIAALLVLVGYAAATAIGLRYQRRAYHAEAKLHAIAALEVHGGEFIDAAALYRILDRPIPPPIDHAANIRARSPYT